MPELVSVVMPCYRAAETLELAVQGVLQQSHQQLELLLLVDGDEPQTLALAKQLAATDSRIRLFCSAHNRGVVRARNLGTRLAKGQWLSFCDADDYWLADKLEQQLAFATKHHANMVCSSFWFWYADRSTQQTTLARLPKRLHYRLLLQTNAIPMSTAMYRLDALGKHYFESLPAPYIHEDYAFWLRLLQRNDVKPLCMPVPTTLIRVLPQSRSANKWLAMRSHAYILAHVAGLHAFLRIPALLAYAFWAWHKRRKLPAAAEASKAQLPQFVTR